jgi:hypothetical protein
MEHHKCFLSAFYLVKGQTRDAPFMGASAIKVWIRLRQWSGASA